MSPRNLFWPFLGSVLLCAAATLGLLIWAAVVGVVALAHTLGGLFLVPLLIVGIIAVVGGIAFSLVVRDGLGS